MFCWCWCCYVCRMSAAFLLLCSLLFCTSALLIFLWCVSATLFFCCLCGFLLLVFAVDFLSAPFLLFWCSSDVFLFLRTQCSSVALTKLHSSMPLHVLLLETKCCQNSMAGVTYSFSLQKIWSLICVSILRILAKSHTSHHCLYFIYTQCIH